MANNNHSYTIDLDINSSQASKRALKELQTAFADSNNSARELNKAYIRLASNVKDTSELDKQYSKVINSRIKDREKEIDKLKAMQIGIINNTKLSETQRKNLLDNTKKRIDLAQQEIDSLNKANIIKIKNMQQEIALRAKEAAQQAKLDAEKLKALKEEEARRKKLSTYIKADLNALKQKIKDQFKFIQTLKTTEGRYNAIKKAVVKAGQLGATVGKAGLKVGAGAAGLAMGLAGAAVAGAERTQQKADALRSLKHGVDESLLDEIFVSTGADYTTIVNAINRVAGLVEKNQIQKFAIAEIKNPGLGLLMAQQSKVDNNFDYGNALNQIRKSTGIQDTSAIIDSAMNSRAVKNGEISQFEHMNAMATLTQVGIDAETAERMITHIARNKGNKSFTEAFNATDLSKLVYDKGLKNTLKNSDIQLETIDFTKQGLEETPQQKAARETAEQLRRFELDKDRMLAEILPGVLPLIKAMMKVAQVVMPLILKALGSLVRGLGTVVKWVEKQLKLNSSMGESMQSAGEALRKAAEVMEENNRREQERYQNVPGGQNVQGGIISSPAIVGETGQPELVLPLDHSRAGRASQIVQNFSTTQNFNMTSAQNTPLAFASAVGQNRFVQRTKVF